MNSKVTVNSAAVTQGPVSPAVGNNHVSDPELLPTLGIPWIARRSNQSILKETNPEYSLEGLILKLKLQYFGHLMGRAHSFEKTFMLGGIGGGKRRGRQRMRQLDGITDSVDMS